VFPLAVVAVLNLLIRLVFHNFFLKLVLVALGFVWSTRGALALSAALTIPRTSTYLCTAASVVFMAQIISQQRKILAVYPVFFFYTFISWMILLQ
jgi:hypothetical protein